MHVPFFIWCAISHHPPFELLPRPPNWPLNWPLPLFLISFPMACTVIFVRRNLIMTSHAYKPPVASLCTVAEIKRIYPGPRGWAWHSPDLPSQLPLPPFLLFLAMATLFQLFDAPSSFPPYCLFLVSFAPNAVVHASSGSLLIFRTPPTCYFFFRGLPHHLVQSCPPIILIKTHLNLRRFICFTCVSSP